MNWLAIVLIVFVAFSWLMTLALCRTTLAEEMSARLADERRAAQQREEERP